MKSVYIKTLGCKVNTFDSHALENQFQDCGYRLVGKAEDPSVTVINTCSVTAVAEKEARYLFRRFRRENPNTFIVVTGCYAQIQSAAITEIEDVDYVVPNEAKDRLVKIVEDRLALEGGSGSKEKFPSDLKKVTNNKQGHFKSALTLFDSPKTERTRAFLKIQDGCNGFCTYCQIPYARGASISVPHQAILAQVKKLVAQGVREIVLTGIHIGDYGSDLAKQGERKDLLLQLLREIFAVEGLRRLRISSLEPSELSSELADLLLEHREQFCEHFHLPLQSGDNRILKLMRREYDQERYLDAIDRVRSRFPQAQITADLLPGFPGEGEDEFEETLRFLTQCDLSGFHVFPYSKRPNTSALRLPNHVEPEIIKQRAKSLRDLSIVATKKFSRTMVGQEAEVLWERFDPELSRWQGKTKNYLSVYSSNAFQTSVGTISQVLLKGFVTDTSLLAIALQD